jgi:hypothetical protein
MIELDVADLVVIAGQAVGIGTDTALTQLDIAAAEVALAEARPAGQEAVSAIARSHRSGNRPGRQRPNRTVAAAAAVTLMHALLRHPPLPGHREQVAAAAGLQFLAVNGWRADLDVPPAAALTVQGLASGHLSQADATSWLEARLSPDSASPDRRAQAMCAPGARARQIILAPFAAVRHHQRRRPGLFVITLGSADKPAGIRTPATGLMPFTGPALRSVILSGTEARRRGQPRGVEHFLLGLAHQDDSVAVKALERLGISGETARRQAENITSQGPPQPPSGRAPDTPQARRAWHAVLDEAVAHGDNYIGTEHFLLALYSRSDTAIVRALASLGAEESQVRAAITAQRAETGAERPD